MNFERLKTDRSWSLFLDRDGVINKKIDGGYVLSSEDMEYIPGSITAIGILSKKFQNIFIVTNQQCVGKGLLQMQDLDAIHNSMLDKIRKEGGIIRDIFVSPHLESEKSQFRKPNTGMAHAAVKMYPETDLKKSVMAGDTKTDMLFGRKAGMVNILISNKTIMDTEMYDYRFRSLLEFANFLK